LTVAGGSGGEFHRKAIALIHERSGGIPRLINQMCDLALVYAFAEQRHQVTPALVEKVLNDRTMGAAGDSLGAAAQDPVPGSIRVEGLPGQPMDGVIQERA
jgi:hypothetical protein